MSDSLYHSLYPDDEFDDDVGILPLNEMYSHLNFDAMSSYFDLKQYNDITSQFNDDQFHLIHFNIRSLAFNRAKIEALLACGKNDPTVMFFSETWLNDDDKDTMIFNGYHSFHVVRENRLHGGVSVFVKDNIDAELIEEFSYVNSEIEICSVRINIQGESYLICALYRPRFKHEHIKEFRKEIAPLLRNKLFKKSKCVITGDFNINLLEHKDHQETNEFLNLMQTFNFLPLITRPTRFPIGQQTGEPSLLDHMYINFTDPIVTGILHHEVTDHLPIFLNLALPKKIKQNFVVKYREFTEFNNESFTRNLC